MTPKGKRTNSQRVRVDSTTKTKRTASMKTRQQEEDFIAMQQEEQMPVMTADNYAAWMIKYYVERFRHATDRAAFAGARRKLGEGIAEIER